jgi:anaerobic magnesium-protoporphyrin IX monomethyl ester cyclase
MRILLVYPRYGTEVVYKSPTGLAVIASCIRKLPGVEDVKLMDLVLYDDNLEDYKKMLVEFKPDVLGLGFSTALRSKGVHVAHIAKEYIPEIKVIAGGADASREWTGLMEHKEIDVAVIGEGEITFKELIEAMQAKNDDYSNILGIAYRDADGKMLVTPKRPFGNMDDIPEPARDLLEMDVYLNARPIMPLPAPATDVDASRGCFGQCTFCQPNLREMFGNKIRSKDPKLVVDEIEGLVKNYGIKGINLGNDEPTFNRKWVDALCDELIKRKLGVKINCCTRVDCVNLDMLKKMKKAGWTHISFGTESGSQKVLNSLRKGITLKQTRQAFKWCNEAGICARANFMIGSPVETKETLQETMTLMKEIKPDFVFLSATYPTAGTHMFEWAKREGKLKDDVVDVVGYNIGYLKLDNLSDQEVRDAVNLFAREFKKLFLSYFWNPYNWWYKRHLHKALLIYWLSLLKKPQLFLATFKYYLNYGKHVKSRKQVNAARKKKNFTVVG